MKTKHDMIELLRAFINQRPGLEYGNYGNPQSYNQESRRIRRQLHDARELLRAVELNNEITIDAMAEELTGRGRLSLTDNGELQYVTGQYFPVEYRAAVCSLCASLLWDWKRDEMHCALARNRDESKGDAIRREFREMFGRSIAGRWFN